MPKTYSIRLLFAALMLGAAILSSGCATPGGLFSASPLAGGSCSSGST